MRAVRLSGVASRVVAPGARLDALLAAMANAALVVLSHLDTAVAGTYGSSVETSRKRVTRSKGGVKS